MVPGIVFGLTGFSTDLPAQTESSYFADETVAGQFDSVSAEGFVQYKIPVGALRLAADVKMPIDVIFNSARYDTARSCGSGWRIPAIDALAIPVSEKHIRVQLPWNQELLVERRDGKPAELSDLTRQWTGRIDGARVLLTGPLGLRLTYDGGYIQELVVPGAEVIQWIRLRPSHLCMIDSKGKMLVEAKFSEEARTLTELTVAGTGRYLFDTVPEGIKALTAPDGTTCHFERMAGLFELSQSGRRAIDPQMAVRLQFGRVTLANFEVLHIRPATGLPRILGWDLRSRKVALDSSEDDCWYYGTDRTLVFQDSEYLPAPTSAKLQRENRAGRCEVVFFDLKRGLYEVTDANGVVTKTYLSPSIGPTNGKVLRVVRRDRAGNSQTILRAWYNKRGQMLRLFQDGIGTVMYDYDDQGRLVRTYDNDKEYLARLYKGERLVFERRVLLSEVTVELNYEESGLVEVTVRNRGRVQSSQRVRRDQLASLVPELL